MFKEVITDDWQKLGRVSTPVGLIASSIKLTARDSVYQSFLLYLFSIGPDMRSGKFSWDSRLRLTILVISGNCLAG